MSNKHIISKTVQIVV